MTSQPLTALPSETTSTIEKSLHSAQTLDLGGHVPKTTCKKIGHSYVDRLDASVLALPRTEECFSLIEADPNLSYNLPTKGALAGRVLKHCYRVLDTHLQRGWPMTYKIGYTHSAHCRWYNAKFGYAKDWKNRWEGMIVVYASSETMSASFVEAAMIQRFKGTLSEKLILQQSSNVVRWPPFDAPRNTHAISRHLRQAGMQE